MENVCKKCNIPFYVKRAEVEKIAKETKKGTEEVGRKIRYDFFDEVAKKEKANKIAIAHNMNDNAETMLLNLIRGTGIAGLEGIQPSEYGKYIRPLINCERFEIEKYCEENDLKPRIDSTNKENIYKRNIIRNKILPELKELNPNIVQTLSRTSKIISNEDEYIKGQTNIIYSQLSNECYLKGNTKNDIKNNENEYKEEKNEKNEKKQIKDICVTGKNIDSVSEIYFDLSKFNSQDTTIKENLVIKSIEKITGSARNIEKVNIDDIIELANKNVGNKFMILNKKIKVEIKNKKIFFYVL